jgi:hypothetical protein
LVGTPKWLCPKINYQEIVVYSPFKLAIDWGFISHYITFIPSISQICPFYIIIPPIFTAYILHSSTKHILVYIYIHWLFNIYSHIRSYDIYIYNSYLIYIYDLIYI